MRIILTKNDDRYGFNILTRFNKLVYSSSKHYFLTPFIKSSYKYAWESCRDAWKLALKYPCHIQELRFARYDMEDPVKIDISAEEMITTHYLSILRDLRAKARGIGNNKEDRKKVYQEIKMVINELQTIQEKITDAKEKRKILKILKIYQMLIQKYFQREKQEDLKEMGNTKIASITNIGENENIASDLISDVLDDYAEKICQAIQNNHPDAYYGINLNSKQITIYDFSNNPLLQIRVNDCLNVDSIIPVGKLYDMYPLHTVSFYQKYWKPIVEGLGHICIGDPATLIKIDNMTLPDVPKNNQSYTLEAWDCKEKKYTALDISFKGEKPIWIIEQSKNIKLAQSQPSKYNELDYLNAIVKCVDPNLKSIHGRTGSVIQVMPLEDMIEIDVDFGRGLGMVRLTEKQIQIQTKV